uniref:Reverse transcriptase domain-containing protein n=1 Tax=Tanacetum cinerariifolium TaxID=118510 RepID=A0A699HL02_TANCI|nr:reverse transcriptase domain-containing protein [Tanacetum cinerariifolium]
MLQEPTKGNNQGRNQFFQGASHGQNPPSTYKAPAYQALGYQAPFHQSSIPQPQVVTTNEFTNFMKANDAILKHMQTNMTSLTNSNLELKNMFGQFMKMNTASSSGSGTLLGNTITNPKEELKDITTRSRTTYQGSTIPTTSSSLPPVVERETKVTKGTVPPTNNESTKDVQPLSLLTNKDKLYELARTLLNEHCSAVLLKSLNLMPLSVWNKLSLPKLSPTCMTLELVDRLISRPVGVAEDVFVKVGTFYFPADFVVVDFDADPQAITFNLDQTSRYLANYNDMMANWIDVIDMACEEYSQEVLGFSDVIVSGNPTPYNDPIVSTSSPTLTPFDDSDFLLKEVDAFLALEDDPTSLEVDQSYFDPEGDILLLEAFLNDDPSLHLPNQGNYLPQVRKELKICEAKTDKSSIDEPPEVELKDLHPHLKYAFLEGDDKLPIIIAKDLSDKEKTTLIMVLKSHNGSIPERVNPKIHNVIKKEVLKLLDAGLTYPICDSPWVSLVHGVPKKGGFTVVANELIPTRLVTGWRVCIDYQKMLKQCEDTNLCLNWEKSHFMVKEGIVLGQKISKNGIEVDKSKVEVIAKLPHPTTVKGAVLGKHQEKNFRPIHYASKTMTEVELNYTITEKNVSRGVCLRKILVLPHHEQKHCVYGSFCPQMSLYQERFLGETAQLGSTPSKVHIQSVYMARKPLTFSRLATMDPPGDIMARTTLPRRLKQKRSPPTMLELFANSLNLSLPDLELLVPSSVIAKRTSSMTNLQRSCLDRIFNVGDRVLLFNSRLKIFSGKLKTRWSGPFTITHVFPYGTVELSQTDGPNFKVNGHRLKHYFREDIPKMVIPDL